MELGNMLTQTILVFGKRDFKPKLLRGGKESHSTSNKVSIHHEDITIINTYSPNTQFHKRNSTRPKAIN